MLDNAPASTLCACLSCAASSAAALAAWPLILSRVAIPKASAITTCRDEQNLLRDLHAAQVRTLQHVWEMRALDSYDMVRPHNMGPDIVIQSAIAEETTLCARHTQGCAGTAEGHLGSGVAQVVGEGDVSALACPGPAARQAPPAHAVAPHAAARLNLPVHLHSTAGYLSVQLKPQHDRMSACEMTGCHGLPCRGPPYDIIGITVQELKSLPVVEACMHAT